MKTCRARAYGWTSRPEWVVALVISALTPHHYCPGASPQGCASPIPTRLKLTMNPDDKLIDFTAERGKRIHDLHEKRLNDVRQAFEQALPLPKGKKATKKPKGTPKKR